MKQQIVNHFDPGGVGLRNGNLFGFPFTYESASTIIIPVPWEATVSFHSGTAQGPQAVLDASPQLDFYDYDNPDGWQQGIYLLPVPDWLNELNEKLRSPAQTVTHHLEQTAIVADDVLHSAISQVNAGCDRMNQWVRTETQRALSHGKKVGILGGDHSVPFGALQALCEKHSDFGILHIDAHCDLRLAYQGFTYSHASIMRNAMTLPQVTRLIQIAIRDVSPAEIAFAEENVPRIQIFHDSRIKRSRFKGQTWHNICQQIVQQLPAHVYISFDIDGLDPKLCPQTGTPVPGGLDFEEAIYLLRTIADSCTIIGFDLCEVGQSEYDGNVAARLLYKLCNLMELSES